MIYGDLFTSAAEKQAEHHFTLQNSKMLKVLVGDQPVMARQGSMVAYQGRIGFEHPGHGGLGRMIRSAATGEGVPLMRCQGQGELFLADQAAEIQVLYLENDQISVNGANVLAFSAGIDWDIHRLSGRGALATGDLFNVALKGTGFVAVTTQGYPVALDVGSAPTFADAQAVVLWTAGVNMDIKMDTGGFRSLIRGGTGETFQMAFSGQGAVIVQPYENLPMSAGGSNSGGGGGGGLGDLFG